DGPGGVRWADVVAAPGRTATIADIPAGDGYLATADATAPNGARCAGTSASFSVVADQTASISLALACAPTGGEASERIGHLVVIYMENHSFDNLYGSFPGAEGLSSPAANIPQIDDVSGLPYQTLPVDESLPSDLPNRPFDISAYVPADEKTSDLVHRFYQEQQQIDGGKMDRFVTVSD